MVAGPQNEFATAEIPLQGRASLNAVASVHSTLASIHGVRSVTVSVDTQEAKVRFDVYKVNPLQFKRALFIIGVAIDTISLTFDPERGANQSSEREHGPSR